MLLRQALRAVGFDVISKDGKFIIQQGGAKVSPADERELAWSVAEQVFWEDAMRHGLFLFCCQQGEIVQVFDLANTLEVLPRAIFEEEQPTQENTRQFSAEVAGILCDSGVLLKLGSGSVIGWLPSRNIAFCVIDGEPSLYAAASQTDAVFLFESGVIIRRQELFRAAASMKPSDQFKG